VRPTVRLAKTQADFFRLIRLREEVFVIEQGVPLKIELDDLDDHALHFVALSGRAVIGTARLVIKGKSGKIGRMAVRKDCRGKGVGSALIDFIKGVARRRGLIRLYLHAQEPAVLFYTGFGFLTTGAPFVEAGIPHRKMVLKMA